jgi:hypothetical protein
MLYDNNGGGIIFVTQGLPDAVQVYGAESTHRHDKARRAIFTLAAAKSASGLWEIFPQMPHMGYGFIASTMREV